MIKRNFTYSFAPEGRGDRDHTVVSAGQGPDTMRGGGGGEIDDSMALDPTLPGEDEEEEIEALKGPQQENR